MEHVFDILKIDPDEFENLKNKKYHEIDNEYDREKMLIVRTYYDFIDSNDCIYFIEKAYNLLLNSFEIKIKQEYKLIISIITLKSFTNKKNLTNFQEKYVPSGEIFNYIADEFKKYLIYSEVFLTDKNINTITIYIVDILVNNELINEKIIVMKGVNYKTYKYYSIYLLDYISVINFNYSFINFNWLEIGDDYYITSIHYSKIYKVNKKNISSNKSFKVKNKNYIINKINIKLFVDEEYKISLKKRYVDEKRVIDEIKNSIKKINDLYDNTNWNIWTKQELSEEQKKLSKLIEEMYIYKFINFDFEEIPIIFPLFLDFRGRKYYSSMIGPTSSKILRLAYYYGYYDKTSFKIENNKYSIEYAKIINDFCLNNDINSDKKYQECVFWSLIGIGKFFVNKNTTPIDITDFIENGIHHYEIGTSLEKDLDKQLEIEHYGRILKSFWKEKIKKRAIIKDATASIYQIFMKKLGPINQESLNYVNLGEKNQSYDTYILNRDKFYIEKCINEVEQKEYNKKLTRKLIKNTIMIIPYSAGFKLCWTNYLSSAADENIKVDKNFIKIFKSFYKFVKKEMQDKYLYSKNTASLIAKMNDEFESTRKYILESDTGEADISYYKMKKSSVDKKYVLNGETKRITRLILIPTTALDITNFNVASGANTAHFYDADEVREIELELNICMITIHDSYLIDINNCTKLIDAKIKHYQKYLNKFPGEYKIKNIFILL